MSRSWTPMELYYHDKKFHFRDRDLILTNTQTGESHYILSEMERELKGRYPEIVLLAQDFLPSMKKENVPDEFLDKVEETIKKIEGIFDKDPDSMIKAYNRKKVPEDITDEMEKAVYGWFIDIGNHYDSFEMTESLLNSMLTIYDIERHAKENVKDYMDNSYDTIEEIH